MNPRVAITKVPMLRNSICQPTTFSRVPIALRNNVQVRNQSTGKDDLGGPGGQEPPPQAPAGGCDVAKRNWPLLGGVALATVAGLAYLMGGGPKKNTIEKQLEPVVRKGEHGLKKLEDEARNAANELSGKKSGGMGGFRSE